MWELLHTNFNRHISLTDNEFETVQSLFRERKFRKKQFILQEGEISRFETFIVKGCTRTYEVDNNGQEHILQFGIEDWWVGDLYSFFTESPSRVNIECIEDCEVLQISKENLELLYRQVPKMERYFRIMIQNAFNAAQHRILHTISKPAAERYHDFISNYPKIEQRIADHHIASYLGIAPQSLSRIRKGK